MNRIQFILFAILLAIIPSATWAQVRFSTGSADVGIVRVGSSGSRSIYLRNTGREEVYVNVSNNCYGDFWVSNGCYGRLGTGSSCHISIRFSPRRAGRQTCSINARDDKGGWDTASVSGTGQDSRRR